MIRPNLETARELAQGHTLLPISLDLYADLKTPVEALRAIVAGGHEAYILESVPDGESWSRYTFLGYKPLMEISGKKDAVVVAEGGARTIREGDPHAILKELISARKSPRIAGMPPFTGGFVGYFAYEYFANIERTLKLSENDEIGMDDFRLLLFDRVIAFDNLKQTISLIINIKTDDLERNYIAGVTELKDMERLVLSRADYSAEPGAVVETGAPAMAGAAEGFFPSFTKEAFCAAVEKIKWHIREGDIFQCVPSVRFKTPHQGGLLQVYRRLRTTNPSAYMFYIRFNGLELSGASPETLVSLKDGMVGTYPLAGTCPRFEDDAETAAHVERLLQDEKELAEHDMLVDLGRNDLGKVCRFGTVKVDEYRSVKKLSQVCHIASRVTGQLAEGYDALDVMAAVLPAGTLSGAPKKRACEIIDGAEGSRRGVYGGAVGYIDFTGNMDLCIGIRMAVLKDGCAYVQAGAGIVADSVPEREYEECLRKASAVLEAFR